MDEVSIYKIETTPERVNLFLHNQAYVDLYNNELLTEQEVQADYKDNLEDHYRYCIDDHDWTFTDYCFENDILNKSDINDTYYWGWATYSLPDGKVLFLVAVYIN